MTECKPASILLFARCHARSALLASKTAPPGKAGGLAHGVSARARSSLTPVWRLPGGPDRPVVLRADRRHDYTDYRQHGHQPRGRRVGRAPGWPALPFREPSGVARVARLRVARRLYAGKASRHRRTGHARARAPRSLRGAMRGALSSADPTRRASRNRARGRRPWPGSTWSIRSPAPSRIAGTRRLTARGTSVRAASPSARHLVAMDYGIKHNILRQLAGLGHVTVVPAQTPADQVMALAPDGVLLSNGPGDPAAVTYAIETVRQTARPRPHLWHLSRTPNPRAGPGWDDVQVKVRAPRREPAGQKPPHRSRRNHIAQSRLCSARRQPAARCRNHARHLNDHCVEGLRSLPRRAFGVCSITRKPRRVRMMRCRCSTNSPHGWEPKGRHAKTDGPSHYSHSRLGGRLLSGRRASSTIRARRHARRCAARDTALSW